MNPPLMKVLLALALLLTLSSGCSEQTTATPTVAVTVLSSGAMRLDGTRVNIAELSHHIRKLRADVGTTPYFEIICSTNATYGALRPALTAANAGGCWKIILNARQDRKPAQIFFMQFSCGLPSVPLSVDLARTNVWIGEREARTNLNEFFRSSTNRNYRITIYADETTTVAEIVDASELFSRNGMDGCDLLPRESGLKSGLLLSSD